MDQEISNKDDFFPRNKQQNYHVATGNNTSDRLKRDEWSEGAVSCLLEAYEAKWILRNRAKLKGHDWEDVAKHVSARGNSTKSPKTQTQCKNKIESMKKRYRSESATAADASSWPLYPRLDLLLRGNNASAASSSVIPPPPAVVEPPQPAIVLPPPPPAPVPLPPPPPLPTAVPIGNGGQNSNGSNGFDRAAKEDIMDAKLSDNAAISEKNAMDTNSSTPALYSDDKSKSKNVKLRSMEKKSKKKRKRAEGWEIGESIRLLAEVVVRSEQARMETMREIERMRAEAEAKRGEMDLKRTEIIANTQLEIAKLFASITKGSVDP
ncbi:PREDICTED: trihelix transcription factor ASIL2 [Nicotiana attenuata]|uniref:Trihelix transcription factor asil2 n=1 Tax=Nicotiana attenuata TaxID=49451 RepID=A0A1J6HZV7_NICAT|nr:PREDICTED: trihelix transcription factor ASIL2 [Nicotiana attenuata]OIS98372.1 trihelix transcription factor asil2 [Nicotiana attenuata]